MQRSDRNADNASALLFHRSIELVPTSPFNFDATMHKPGHFPAADNAWVPGCRWQTMLWRGQPLGLKIENRGTLDDPGVALTVYSANELTDTFLRSVASEVANRCSFQLDLRGFETVVNSNPVWTEIFLQWRGMRPATYTSLYEYLIISIVLQNCNVRRSVNMLATLFQEYGTFVSFDGQLLYSFWSPEKLMSVSEEELRALKVGYRAKSLNRVTEAFAAHRLDEERLRGQTREEQRSELLKLYGIGPASVGYVLFDVFHHLDELNHISPWEQKIYSRLFFGTDIQTPVPAQHLLKYFQDTFGGYRMLAVHYIWEDLFWKRKSGKVDWLEKLIRL